LDASSFTSQQRYATAAPLSFRVSVRQPEAFQSQAAKLLPAVRGFALAFKKHSDAPNDV
jgi:hypothetical protein